MVFPGASGVRPRSSRSPRRRGSPEATGVHPRSSRSPRILEVSWFSSRLTEELQRPQEPGAPGVHPRSHSLSWGSWSPSQELQEPDEPQGQGGLQEPQELLEPRRKGVSWSSSPRRPPPPPHPFFFTETEKCHFLPSKNPYCRETCLK